MKININLFKVSPCYKYIGIHRNNVTLEINEWFRFHGFELIREGDYINIEIPVNITDVFSVKEFSTLMDGFSPNRNKKLHIGHLSNLIIAKALSSLNENTVTIYTVNNVDGIADEYTVHIKSLMEEFSYEPMDFTLTENTFNLIDESILIDGKDKFSGTKYIEVNEVKKVCYKQDGSTSYFMEDLPLLYSLSGPFKVAYVTGKEQIEHFDTLKKFAIQYLNKDVVNHIPCGHVQVNGKKLSSRDGNVIYAEELIQFVADMFDGNRKLAWNIIAGQILSTRFESDKKLNTDTLDNPKTSVGLYLSYTLARLVSAGIKLDSNYKSSLSLFVIEQSRSNTSCNTIINHLRYLAQNINMLYDDKLNYSISNGKTEVIELFNKLGSELLYGMKLLGLYKIDKV